MDAHIQIGSLSERYQTKITMTGYLSTQFGPWLDFDFSEQMDRRDDFRFASYFCKNKMHSVVRKPVQDESS